MSLLFLTFCAVSAARRTAPRLNDNTDTVLSFYANTPEYLCSAIVNSVLQNRCGSPLDVVITYSDPKILFDSLLRPREFGTGAALRARYMPPQRQIANAYWQQVNNKFNAMHVAGYNYTIFMDSDQIILRDLTPLINRHLAYDIAATIYNANPVTDVGVISTVIVTHNYPQAIDIERNSALAKKRPDLPDGEIFGDAFARKQFRRLGLPGETMCYTYSPSEFKPLTNADCSESYTLHFYYGGKPWRPNHGTVLHEHLRHVLSVFGESVRKCVATKTVDLRQDALVAALGSYPFDKFACRESALARSE